MYVRKSKSLIEKTCPTCSAVFNVSFRQRNQRFCCKRCVNKNRNHTDEWKQKMSDRNSGTGNPFYGMKHSKESIEKIKSASLGKTWEEIMGEDVAKMRRASQSVMFSGDGNPFWGMSHTSASITLISEHHRDCSGAQNPMHGCGDKISGDRNGSWMGGISPNPYASSFTEQLKFEIRQRDKFVCKICNGRGWDVHHIDYDKHNSVEKNLITLCRSCHMKTNFNRDAWMRFFNA